MKLTPEQEIAYFHRSFTAVDGLWFVMLEREFGFEKALEIDVKVWEILPKIQARKLKEITGKKTGINDLFDCLVAKLTAESFVFDADKDPNGSEFTLTIRQCPWLHLLKKSNRQEIADTIGHHICNTEYQAWAGEFGDDIRCQINPRLCAKADRCVLQFKAGDI